MIAALAETGRLVAIASGKGGVGKTWLSATLADGLARAGQRVRVSVDFSPSLFECLRCCS